MNKHYFYLSGLKTHSYYIDIYLKIHPYFHKIKIFHAEISQRK